jgi:hypothetical protein
VTPGLFHTPYQLVSVIASARGGPLWALEPAEVTALSECTAEVVNELLPFLPLMEDNPLAAAIAQLGVAIGTVVGTRVAVQLVTAQAASASAPQQAEAAQPAGSGLFGGG